MLCNACGVNSQGKYDFCPNCGAYIKHQSHHRFHIPKFTRPDTATTGKATPNPPEPGTPGKPGVGPTQTGDVRRGAASTPGPVTPGPAGANGSSRGIRQSSGAPIQPAGQPVMPGTVSQRGTNGANGAENRTARQVAVPTRAVALSSNSMAVGHPRPPQPIVKR